MDIKTEYVKLSVSDGTSMRAYVATAAGAKRGLFVMQEAFGVNAHIRDIAERFAREGYLAIAPEFFHRSGEGFEGRYDDFPSAMQHMQALRDPQMEADFRAAYDWLKASGGQNLPVGAVGFCMGGRAAVLASTSLPLDCGISFYGGGIAPSQYNPGLLGRIKDVSAPLLLFWGGKDSHIGTAAMRVVTDALTAAGKSFANVEFSDADHGFFCDARATYHPLSAAVAWPMALAFLSAQISARERGIAAR
jgi:carboxymethylenebutenolidase